ncbi:MAG: acyl-CoA dehydrogenase family protein [Alicyclobacillus sp.]|nr:acyl-CoA dehydrogenase family protein [Alicyclobacillus sp.]
MGQQVRSGAFLLGPTAPELVFTPEDFTQEHHLIAQTTRAFVEGEIAPCQERLEHQDWDLTLQLLRKLGNLGLLAADVPEEYGGLGADKVASAVITENITWGGSFALTVGGHTGIGTLPIVYFGSEEQKRKYLPGLATGELVAAYALTEPGSGSDALSARTTARKTPDGKAFVLNGSKQFITNAAFADVFIVYAKIDGEQFSAFIVERGFPGVSTGPEEKKMGIKASSTRPLLLEDAVVPAENLLGEAGKGHVIAFNILNMGRHKLAVGCVGAMKAAMAESARYALTRRQFGKAIAEFPLIQQKLADMAIRCFVTESMCYRTTGDMDRQLAGLSAGADGSQVARGIAEYAMECSVNKVYASEALDEVVDEAVQIHGGYGFIQEYAVERMYRDSRINRIFEGTNEINRLLIPDMLLRKALRGELPLLSAAQALQQELMGMLPDPDLADPLGVEEHALAMAKKLFLLTGGLAVQTWQQALREEQEVLAALADQVMEVYALDSALLRTRKALTRGQPAEAMVDMVRVYARTALDRVVARAHEVLAALATGDELRTHLALVRKLTRHVLPVNTRQLKRAIAGRVLAAEGYRV